MRKRISVRVVEALRPGQILWDSSVTGFGVRRQNSEAITYFVYYRVNGRQRWMTVGRHGAPWTPDMARAEAQRILGAVATGGDPAGVKEKAKQAGTMAELCDLYFADAEAGRIMTRFGTPKRASTLAVDKGRIARHIIPLIGKISVAAITQDDIEALLHDVAAGKTKGKTKTIARGLARVTGGQGAANRSVRLLQGIFGYAIKKRMRKDNPAHGVRLFKDGQRTRTLSEQEYRAMGQALRNANGTWPAVPAIVAFLALTGWRSGEALSLRWEHIDLEHRTATLPDTKSGKSMRALSVAACDVLKGLPLPKSGLVFPASRGDGIMSGGFKKGFRKIVHDPTITPHTLRHSFCSVAADPSGLGYSELTIGLLVGHKSGQMTSKYIHHADPVLLHAADAVSKRIAQMMQSVI
jgi:integrase